MAISTVFFDRLRQLGRRLAKTPMFTAITLLTLALGVGATTTIFSVVEGVLLKPLPYPHPDQLVGVRYTAPGIGIKDLSIAPFLYFINREQGKTLEDIGVYDYDSVSVTGVGEPEHVSAIDLTSGTLPLLGVKPVAGRLFTDADDSAGSPETVLLTYGYWRKRFGADPSAIGRVITLDGKPHQIIGVLPRGFQFLNFDVAQIVIPMQWDRNKTKLGNFSYGSIARLKPGVSMEQASADLARLIPIALKSFPPPEGFSAGIFEKAGMAPNPQSLKQQVVGDVGSVLWVLMGSIVMVLLIACANVANLLLVRVEGRRQELAIRVALGAGWRQVAGELLLESLVLGFAGSLLGLGLAFGALRVLVAMAPTGLPRVQEIGIDFPVLLFTFGLALFTSLVIGAIPVFKYAGSRSTLSLREGGRGQSQSRAQHRTRSALVVLQVALALVLLICSGLMIRTFEGLTHVDPGFSSAGTLQTFRLSLPETQAKTGEQTIRMEQEIRDKIAAIPGVNSVAIISALPMTSWSNNDLVFAQDRVYAEGQIPPIRRFKKASPGVFSTMGTRMIAGRDFTWEETYGKRPVAIISENFAREYWHGASNALGKRIRVASTDDWREIVGVVSDMYDNGVSDSAPTTVYWPLLLGAFEGTQEVAERNVAYVVRTPRAGSQAFMAEVGKAVWSINSDLPLADANTQGFYFKQSMARTSFTLIMLSVAGAMALLLGVVGIYGVISYAVSQRTREIGIRMALGAQRQAIIAMFLRHGLLLTGLGVIFGLVASFASMRLMSSLLFNVSPVDPVTYGTIPVAIVLIAWVACYLPSRRAASVDPVDALRSE